MVIAKTSPIAIRLISRLLAAPLRGISMDQFKIVQARVGPTFLVIINHGLSSPHKRPECPVVGQGCPKTKTAGKLSRAVPSKTRRRRSTPRILRGIEPRQALPAHLISLSFRFF